jgi:hypothetical protein
MANGASRAHRLAVMAIMLDIITFAVGIGFIFVAIGHDAGGSLECTSVNGLCKGTIYSLNFAPKATGATASSQAVPKNTNYCTGITAGPFVTGGGRIQLWGTWVLADLNVTGQVFNPTAKIGTAQPFTVFQAGSCQNGGTVSGNSLFSVYAPISGAASQWTGATSFATVALAAGTYYAWIDFQVKNTDVLMTSFGTLSSITMLEIK